MTVLLAAVGVAWAAGLVGGDWIARNYDVDRTSQEYAEGWDAGRKVASGVGTTTGAQVVRSCTDILKLDYGGQLPPNESTFIGCVEGASESLYLDPVEVLKNK